MPEGELDASLISHSLVFFFLVFSSIFFIFLDELIMGCTQRRIGPLNLGRYGILASLINGCNPIIPQFLVPKVNVHFGFQAFPIFFFPFSFWNYIIPYPFSFVDVYLSMILVFLLTCLLYTSPSPRDATLSRMPSSA